MKAIFITVKPLFLNVLRPDENGRGIEEGSCVIEGVSMDKHVIQLFKILDIDNTLHSRVLEEGIVDDLDRPDIFSDDYKTFDLQGVLR